MTNLFSIFDYEQSIMGCAWVSVLLPVMALPASSWVKTNSLAAALNSLVITLKKEFSSMSSPLAAPGMSTFTLSLFLMIWVSNLMGLFPFVFSPTAHPSLALSLMLPLWVGQFVYAWTSNPVETLAHLVPVGTPGGLIPVMVLIELLSNAIRPLTLTVRLVANISAGHLLLSLCGGIYSASSALSLIVACSASMALVILELGVALIQAYVFTMLLTMFVAEVNSISFFK